MGNEHQCALKDITNEQEREEKRSYSLDLPMTKTTFFKIQPLTDPDQEGPTCEEEDDKKLYLKKIDQIKVKWRSFIKMREGNFLEEYQVKKQLGRGGFGSVFKVKGIYNGTIRAAKKIKKSDLDAKQHERLFNEVSILQSLDHPNIVKLYEVYDMEDQYVLIMQLCEGGQLFRKIAKKKLNKYLIPKIMRQLMEVLAYIHLKGIVHRDIKPENILFQKETGDIKIIDFGIAEMKKCPDQILTSRIGTAYYIAPQVLCKEYGDKCDIWSAGIVLYMMLFYKPPFTGSSEAEIIQSILNDQILYQGPVWQDLPIDCKDLLTRMLKKKPKNRISAIQALQNKWLNTNTKEMETLNPTLLNTKTNMEQFYFRNRLEAVVYTYCISQLVTNEEKKGLEEVFKKIDTDFDGIISIEQLREILKQRVKDEERLQSIMRLIDLDGSGQIEYTQFLIAALNPRYLLTIEHYQKAFDYFDIDHSGGISYEQVAKFLQDKQSQDAIREIFCQIDSNSDGNISRQQFVTLFLRNATKSMKDIIQGRKATQQPQRKSKKLKRKQNSFYQQLKH